MVTLPILGLFLLSALALMASPGPDLACVLAGVMFGLALRLLATARPAAA